MKLQTELIRFCLVNFIIISSCKSVNIQKSPARVLVTEDRSVEDGYMVKVEANREVLELKLALMENVWSDDAQAVIVDFDESGQQIFEIKKIPQNFKIYRDSEIGSILSIRKGRLNGILDSEFMIESDDNGQHFVMKSKKKTFDEFDYLQIPDIPKMIIERFPIQRNISEPIPLMDSYYRNDTVPIPLIDNTDYRMTTYTAEIAVIVDSTLAALIGTDDQCYLYLTIFWNAVNERYKTIKNPIINIRLIGSYIIRNTVNEPFITNHLSGISAKGDNVLDSLSSWIFSNSASLPVHDIIYLQSGRNLIDDESGDGLAGIAYVGGACLKNSGRRSYSVGIGEDMGAYYDGVHTATHEIAHTLGSPHDNNTASGTGTCPWNDGYIMSYVPGTINRLFFSSCSISKMSTNLALNTAACVKTNIAQTTPPGKYTSTNLPGNNMSMTEQCKQITGKSNANVATVTPEDSLCYNLKCTWSDSQFIYTSTTFRTAAEGAACPSGLHCHHGACI